MTFRRTGKLLTLVGFVICLSLLGILYGNLSTITEERDHILVKKNEIKQEVEELNSRISNLQEKISRLESSLNTCNAAKLEAEEGKGLLRQEVESYKNDIEQRKLSEENLKSSSDQQIQKLQAQLTDITLEKSGHQEAAEACKNTNEDLLDQLNAGKQKIDKLEKSNSECASELRHLMQKVEELSNGEADVKEAVKPKDDAAAGEEVELNPVAALPVPREEAEHKDSPLDPLDHVADIPEAPQDKAVVDTNQDIGGAVAPAPVANVEKPAVPAEDIGGAVAPAPGGGGDFKRDVEEELPEAVGDLPEGMGGFQPLQPIPDAALAETLDKVREEEQLQQLQERQDLLQPQLPQFPGGENQEVEDNLQPLDLNNNLHPADMDNLQPLDLNNNLHPADLNNLQPLDLNNNLQPADMQPALPAEIQPAQPAPNNVENVDFEDNNEVDLDGDRDENDDNDNEEFEDNSVDNDYEDNSVERQVQLGLLPEVVPPGEQSI